MPAENQTGLPLYLTLGYLRSLFDYLRARGFALRPVLQAMGLDESALHDLDQHVPDIAEDQAFLAAEQLTGDPNIGLHVGQNQQPMNLGILGHLIMSCTHMQEVFDLHLRYSQLIGNATLPEYRPLDDAICLVLHRHEGQPPHCRQSIEFAFAGYIRLARMIGGDHITPQLVEFRHAAPADLREQEQYFRCPLRFGSGEDRLHYPAAMATLPLLRGDAHLRELLEREAQKRLQLRRGAQTDADPQLARIKDYIAQSLIHGVPDIETAAAALGLNVRRLQRELDTRRTNYRQLVETVRLGLAERYARDTSLSLVDIALMLGFSEQSAFQRAFRRWFNTTPGDYRRAQGVMLQA